MGPPYTNSGSTLVGWMYTYFITKTRIDCINNYILKLKTFSLLSHHLHELTTIPMSKGCGLSNSRLFFISTFIENGLRMYFQWSE